MIIARAVISPDCLNRMESYGLLHHPNEACGLLLGSTSVLNQGNGQTAVQAELQIEQFIGIPNIASNPRRQFMMDPAAVLPYVMAEQRGASRIAGIMHTHPLAPAIPSQEDLGTAWLHTPSHWILSLRRKDIPEWGIFQYRIDAAAGKPYYEPVPLQINGQANRRAKK